MSKMAHYWFQFGMNLGIAEKTLQDLDKSDLIPDNVARCVVVLRHYMNKEGPIENNMEKLNGAIEQTLADSEEANVGNAIFHYHITFLHTPSHTYYFSSSNLRIYSFYLLLTW